MRSFKMKDLMIRIQPETSGTTAYTLLDSNRDYLTPHNLSTCTSPSVICSSAQSCRPSRCPKKPKPKKHHEDEVSVEIMELTDLKNMLAEMQIKMDSHVAETAPMLQ